MRHCFLFASVMRFENGDVQRGRNQMAMIQAMLDKNLFTNHSYQLYELNG